jgi:hypothetical protein
MRHSISLNGSFFNTQRMVQQYVVKAYLESSSQDQVSFCQFPRSQFRRDRLDFPWMNPSELDSRSNRKSNEKGLYDCY